MVSTPRRIPRFAQGRGFPAGVTGAQGGEGQSQSPQRAAIQQKLPSQMTEQELLRRMVERWAPAESINAFWPNDGSFGLYPAGLSTFDFLAGKVNGPKGPEDMGIPTEVLTSLEAFSLYIDIPATLQFFPGYGKFLYVPEVIQANLRDIDKMQVDAPAPYGLLITASTGPIAPSVAYQTAAMTRKAQQTITKTTAAGLPDDIHLVNFSPYFATKTLTVPARASTSLALQFANPLLLTDSYPLKSVLVRNLDTVNGIKVNLLGAIDIVNASALGFAPDFDNPAAVAVAASGVKSLQSGYGWQYFEVGIQVEDAAAEGTESLVIVEFAGMAPGVR